jgi:hypothetical protein
MVMGLLSQRKALDVRPRPPLILAFDPEGARKKKREEMMMEP